MPHRGGFCDLPRCFFVAFCMGRAWKVLQNDVFPKEVLKRGVPLLVGFSEIEAIILKGNMGQSMEADHGQIFLLPPALEDWVPADHPVRFIHEFVMQLDFKKLGVKMKAKGEVGTNHYGERLLMGVWLYGYFERIRSSRKLAKALGSDLPLIWLAGLHRPDHCSLWRFWSLNKSVLRKVFKETVLVADRMDMVGFALMALDGTKMQASGSRRAMWSAQSLAEKEKLLEQSIAELEQSIGEEGAPAADASIPKEVADKRKLVEEIKAKRAELAKLGLKHMHPREPDARVMKNQRNHDLCYNAQAVADSKSQIVTAADVTSQENDMHQLVPMVDQVVANLGRAAEETLADSGYATEEQFGQAEERGYAVLTATKRASSTDANPFRADLFHYDQQAGTVTCPVNGTELKFEIERERKHTGVMIKVFRCKNKECPFRAQCSKQKRGKTVEIAPGRVAAQNQAAKQKLPESKARIRERAGIIEPVFALAKAHGGLRRFTFKGLEGVQAQWAMEMAGHNLRKIFQVWQKNSSKGAA
jgi:transposase